MSSPNDQRPASSRFRWVICALLFFSTTFNYMDRQVVSYLKDYFCRPNHQVGRAQTISRDDVVDLKTLAGKLKQPANAISAFIKTNLSPATLAALVPGQGRQRAGIPDQSGCGSQWAGQRGVHLHPRTFCRRLFVCGYQGFAGPNPSGDALLRMNRLLVADAYPMELSRNGFGWSNTDFANLISFFTAFYAGITIVAGWLIDKIGTKIGLAISLILWSVFGILNAFVGQKVMMHVLVRSAFGVGEGGNFPASIKTVAEWFPKRERALATGIFNSGSNFGAMVAALFVPWCLIYFGDELGWKMAFIITGAVGFVWLIFWFWLYEIPARHRRLSRAEYDYIHSDKDEAKAEEKPVKNAGFGKLFSFSGRIPRASFWGTLILAGILTAFVYLMTTLIVVPNGKIICGGRHRGRGGQQNVQTAQRESLCSGLPAGLDDSKGGGGCVLLGFRERH